RDRRKMKDDDLALRRDVFDAVAAAGDRLAFHDLVFEVFAGVEVARPGRGNGAAGANLVDVRARPRPRLGVVVVEIERVRLRLLQVVDDLAILVGPFAEPRRDARPRGAEPGRRPRAQGQRRLGRRGVPEADADPPIRLL